MNTGRVALEIVIWLSDQAFRGDPRESLLANVRRLRAQDRTAKAKWMYEDHAVGIASLRGEQPPLGPADGGASRDRQEVLDFLAEGHGRRMASITALACDGEPARERLTNWGEPLPARTLIQILIAHHHYHAGEIDRLRSLLQGTDRRAYEW